MKTMLAIVFATIYGVVLRVIFGFFNNIMGIMSITFLVLVPVLIGYITVYASPEKSVRSKTAAFFLPWLTSIAILLITLLIELEGAICWFMLFPLFAILAGLGGLVAHHHRGIKEKGELPMDSDKDIWEDKNQLKVSLIFLIPLLIATFEGDSSLSPEEITLKKECIIQAAPAQVWNQILYKNQETIKKKSTPLCSFLGFPKHINTTLDSLKIGGVRMAYYERGLYFKETITAFEPQKRLVLDIHTDPHNIPPTVMDEHILIGGKHIDILEDIYTLEALADGKTKLTLSSRYYINTPFNWYAGWWAKFLMSEMLEGELGVLAL